jgi:Ca-activated chloride channel family protein
MVYRHSRLAGVVFSLAALFAVAASSQQAGSGPTKVCVVAVRDSGLFTMCPSAQQIKEWRYPGRTPSLEIIQNPEGPRLALSQHIIRIDRPVLDRSRAEWWDIVGHVTGSCPSGKIDLELKQAIEKELGQRRGYAIVDSWDKAQIVFLAEGLYADASSGFIGAQINRIRVSGIPLLAVVMAIAVPADVYGANPADGEILLDAKSWEGSVAWKSNPAEADRQPASAPASVRQLVGQFAGEENETVAFPPLCAPRILTPTVDPLGNPRAKAQPKTLPRPAPAETRAPGPDSQSGGVIRVSVDMVTVPTVVSDAGGRHVPDLTEEDFHVFENDVEQPIDRVIPEVTPFNVVLMMDTSGSTMFKHDDIQRAALVFLDALRPEERVMIVTFDGNICLDAGLTTDRAVLRRAILRTDTGAGTRLYDALDIVLTDCLSRIEGRKAIVLFTDGIDSQSWLARLGAYRSKIEESDAILYAVQFDSLVPSPASAFLKGLTDKSGGKLFLASTTSNLSGAFAEIADELKHQYTICYYPSMATHDAALRQIRISVDQPGVKVRARAGYRFPIR